MKQCLRSGIRDRAKGGIITVIGRFDGLGVRAITFNEGAGGVPLWTYQENGSLDLSIPYSYVQVVTTASNGSSYCNCWTSRKGGVNRSRGRGTTSYHQDRKSTRLNSSHVA